MKADHNPKKILILKLRKLGDVLLTTPAIRQLNKLYPQAEITIITEPLGAQVFKNSSSVNRVWIIHRNPTTIDFIKLCYKVYKERFDIVIDFYHHNKTALITNFSRAPHRYGFAKGNKKPFSYNHSVALTDENYTHDYTALHNLKLTETLGTNYEDLKLEFDIDQVTKDYGTSFAKEYKFTDKVIAFCVQSERADAQVSQELLADVGNWLIAKGYDLYFVYGPGERELTSPVYDKIINKNKCIIDYTMPTVPQVRAIFEHCFMYIGNDGGNKHIAVAVNRPSIGFFNGDRPNVWTPSNSSKHRYLQTLDNLDALDSFKKIFNGWSSSNNQFKMNNRSMNTHDY